MKSAQTPQKLHGDDSPLPRGEGHETIGHFGPRWDDGGYTLGPTLAKTPCRARPRSQPTNGAAVVPEAAMAARFELQGKLSVPGVAPFESVTTIRNTTLSVEEELDL
jgi:hypothetical protein